jgi:uncharacterized protein (TIGR03437 family)
MPPGATLWHEPNMGSARLIGALIWAFAPIAFAQSPTVGGLLNNYGYTLPGLPNYGIAQGSIFDVFGNDLASTTSPLLATPAKSVNGVSISVTVNGTTTTPLIYFVSPGQIAAVLPSATPAGDGTLTVTTSAGASPPFGIQVVPSSFGILTLNNGAGPAVGYDANNNSAAFSYTNAINPGEIVELWGTGLGPVANDATDTVVGVPVEVDIGGVPASVQYAGRSASVGLDQINVVVPPGVSGCNVSVVVVESGVVSNFATLPVASSGRVCSDLISPFTPTVLNDLGTSGTFSYAFIDISQTSLGGASPETSWDDGIATFARMSAAEVNSGQYALAFGQVTSIGSCNVSTFQSVGPPPPPKPPNVTYLNAGSVINIGEPGGAATWMSPRPTNPAGDEYGIFGSCLLTCYPTFIPATGGAFTFNNGSGGEDVGPFTANLQVPAPIVWSNMNSLSSPIQRANGVTITWTGGDSGTYVQITGSSQARPSAQGASSAGGMFTCLAPSSASAFAVPPAVLLALPPNYGFSWLAVSNYVDPVQFTAPNIDYAFVEGYFRNIIVMAYQ